MSKKTRCYWEISDAIWAFQSFRDLSVGAKLDFFFILFNPVMGRDPVREISIRALAVCAQGLGVSAGRLLRNLEEIEESGLIQLDSDRNLVLLHEVEPFARLVHG